jgi:mannose-6-phosphate isomerase-like protein (cupin superfamily)
MVERIEHNKKVLAIIVRCSFKENGINFFTPNEYSQQLAFMSHKSGKEIQPHIHKPVQRSVNYTQETLFIRKGKLQVDFYTNNQEFLESRILETGDVILLIKGGHGFKVLEDLEMFEVKQGPYAGDEDKIKFQMTNGEEIDEC